MSLYKQLRKNTALTDADRVARIDARLETLRGRFREAFDSSRPDWVDLLDWIERVEFEIPPTAMNRYSLLKRRWRFETTIPKIAHGSRLLDLGCGLGTDALLLHLAAGVRTTGIDMNDLSLETCRVRLKHYRDWLGISADVVQDPRKMNATNLAFDDESFDCVWSNESIEHIHPPETLFREISRILRPGGTAFVINQNGFSLYEQLKAIRTRGLRVYYPDTDPLSGEPILIAEERLLTPRACSQMLRDAGFGRGTVSLNGTIPSPLARLASPDTLARVDGFLSRVPLLRSQASDFVLIASKDA